MDNYNDLNLPQWDGTRIVPRTGVMARMASNGAIRLRSKHSMKNDIEMFHGSLTLVQKDAFLNFYNANRVHAFTVTTNEDSTTRTCVFAEKGYNITPKEGAYDLKVYMLEQ